jgi:hypothetical protein
VQFHTTELADSPAHSQEKVDPIEEMRLRTWARSNYAPQAERSDSWHPIVLDEMSRIDGEDTP